MFLSAEQASVSAAAVRNMLRTAAADTDACSADKNTPLCQILRWFTEQYGELYQRALLQQGSTWAKEVPGTKTQGPSLLQLACCAA